MDAFAFRWQGTETLATILKKPIRAASLQMHGVMPGTLTLWHADGSWLDIWCQMVDLDDRREVGILAFELSRTEPTYDRIVFFNDPTLEISKVHRLTIDEGRTVEESGIAAEAGVLLDTKSHGTIRIVGSSFPCAIAIDGLFDIPHIFEPEYEISAYTRSEMT